MDADFLEKREKQRSKARIAAAAARDGTGLLGGMKKMFATLGGKQEQEPEVGMSSIQVRRNSTLFSLFHSLIP